ncbi:response regulator [Marivirga atlantica]|uniref:Response regulator transcription factor n=1 Tax=Marivirga atlantica TaxID=1548457 RepID=A0A937DH79_9BACT|nr:response regulator transcription factor [Marivirga atlantica]MBL0763715.1 response regulator transcription factor [Marivirga atlantica]
MKILLVDDHVILMDGIKSLLEGVEEFEVVATKNTAEDALLYLKQQDIDILVTDYNLPGMDGLDLVRAVKKVIPKIKIIVLSQHDEVHLVKEILKEGVQGYILKKDTHKELISAIHQISEGKMFMSSEINKLLVDSLSFPDEHRLLTDREREILKLIAQEYTNKMIAEALFISERTVETHRKNIFRKTKTNSLVGLIKFGYANNLI